MSIRTTLRLLFVIHLLAMLAVTTWASIVQPVWQWQGLTRAPDHAWTIATLADAYFGFITFFVWVCVRELRVSVRLAWFVAIMLLGNMAMASYVLMALARWPASAPLAQFMLGARYQQSSQEAAT